MRLLVLGISCWALTLIGCAKGTQSLDSQGQGPVLGDSEPENPDTIGLEHSPVIYSWGPAVSNQLQTYSTECEECHPAVATLVSFIGQKPHTCGGTLIDENRVLTARHCLEKSRQLVGADCQGSAYFLFPQVGTLPAAAAACVKVEAVAPSFPQLQAEEPQPDWAIVTIDRRLPDRVATVNMNGLKDGEKVRFFKIMYDKEKRLTKFKRYQCINFHESDLEPSAESEINALILIRCDRMFSKGFSGFGIFNSQGELVGNQSHVVHPERRRPRNSHHAVGSNIGCILDNPNPDPAVEKDCEWQPEVRQQRKRRIMLRRLKPMREKIQEAFAKWLEENPQPVEWVPIDPADLSPLPPEYREHFEARRSEDLDFLGKDQADQLTVLMLPYYPKCWTELKTEGFNYPVVHIDIELAENGRRPEIKFNIETLPGGMAKGEKGWHLGHTQNPQRHPQQRADGGRTLYSGFISKKVDITRCE